MSIYLRLNAIAVVFLGAAYCYFFDLAKHSYMLGSIIPFGNDPYDSVGSMGAILSIVLGIVIAFRALQRANLEPDRSIFFARTQMAVVIAVLVSLTSDIIAMLRHPAMWMGHVGTSTLVWLMVGLLVPASAILFATGRSTRSGTPTDWDAWRQSAFALSTLVIVLAIFPEDMIRSVAGEILALATGFILLVWPTSAVTKALVPYRADEERYLPRKRSLAWIGVVGVGVAFGLYLLMLLSRTGIPHDRLAIVIAAYIGAGGGSLALAYAFLSKPLGLFGHADRLRS